MMILTITLKTIMIVITIVTKNDNVNMKDVVNDDDDDNNDK